MRARRKFAVEYKQQVARMVVDDGLGVADVCREQDLSEKTGRRWANQLKVQRVGDPVEGRSLTAAPLRQPRRGAARHHRLHRGFVQHGARPLDAELCGAQRLRAARCSRPPIAVFENCLTTTGAGFFAPAPRGSGDRLRWSGRSVCLGREDATRADRRRPTHDARCPGPAATAPGGNRCTARIISMPVISSRTRPTAMYGRPRCPRMGPSWPGWRSSPRIPKAICRPPPGRSCCGPRASTSSCGQPPPTTSITQATTSSEAPPIRGRGCSGRGTAPRGAPRGAVSTYGRLSGTRWRSRSRRRCLRRR
ncbi:transposase [Ectothiorhodospiraceae bacterium WFHF3C12]|nr:transposase [Ectothiorhodospiraceae bacterium WFHF3C12]